MAEWQYARTEVDDRIAVLTIDHPPVNSLSTKVLQELEEAVAQLVANEDVKVVIITGGGKSAFVAGADIREMRAVLDQPEDGYGAARRYIRDGQVLFRKIERAPKPFIAAIDGFCLGGGLELAMACHMRICSDRTRLGSPEIRLGLIPGWGGTQRLARLAGTGKALELILTGDMIRAQEAYRIGLVNKVVPAAAVLAEAQKLALSIVTKSSITIAAALQSVVDGLDLPIEEGLAVEAKQFVVLVDKEDTREGLDAFLEKRQPQFRDR